MNEQKDNNDIIETLKEKDLQLRKERIRICDEIHNIDNELIKINDQIRNLCDHNWIVDHSYCDHKTVFICKKCNINKF